MKKRFIVALDSSTAAQNDRFVEFINDKGWAWWHWVSNFWLLVDSRGELTAAELRTALGRMYPEVDRMVIELQADGTDTWAGYGPKSPARDMFAWVQRNWKRH